MRASQSPIWVTIDVVLYGFKSLVASGKAPRVLAEQGVDCVQRNLI